MKFVHLILFVFLLLFLFPSCDLVPESKTPKTTIGVDSDYEDFGRVIWQKPNVVIGHFSDIENKTIADIGAGSGFFSKRLAANAKKVIAIDIDEHFIEILDSIRISELSEAISDKLEPRLSKMDDPLLEQEEVDGVIIANTFMYMSDRVDYLKKLNAALTPSGEIIIVDFKKKWTPVGPPVEIRLSMESTADFLEEAGFEIMKKDKKLLEYQYIVVAKKR